MKYKKPRLYLIDPMSVHVAACVSGDAAGSTQACAAGPDATGGCGSGAAATDKCKQGAAAGHDCDAGAGVD